MRWLAAIGRDVRQALHALRAAPAFTATAVMTLALGIGANTAVFSVVNALLFRPLPVPGADRLVVLASSREGTSALRGLSYPELSDYRSGGADLFEAGPAGYIVGFVGLAAESWSPARVLVTWVTGEYFPLLGLTPAAGRLIDAGDVAPGLGSNVAVLGYETWRMRFGADPSIIGRTVRINGETCNVVGVAPRGFRGTFAFSDTEVYLPVNQFSQGIITDRGARGLHTLARLRPGVTIDRAKAVLDVVARRLQTEYPASTRGVRVTVIPERVARPEEDNARSNTFGATIILFLVGLVFVASAVNLMNLLIARAAARRRELAIRVAIGASRRRLVEQMAVETLVLAAAGGAAGLFLARVVVAALAAVRLPGSLPVLLDFHIDWRVLVYALALTVFTAATVGVLAAARAARVDVDSVLRDRRSGARPRTGLRTALVIAQTAACFVLLAAGAMFARSLRAAQHMDLGFDARGVLNVQMDVAQAGYTDERGRELFDEIERRVRRMPAVNDLSYAMTVPLGYVRLTARVAEESASAHDAGIGAGWNVVGSQYFAVMRIAIVRGRAFADRDTADAPRVAIINQQLGSALWPGQDPLGRRFVESDGTALQVVGVAATSKYRILFEDPEPYYYVPLTQRYSALRVLQLRTSIPRPESLAPDVARVIRQLEPALPIYDVQTMEEALNGGYGFFLIRTAALFALVLGGLAASLATVGLYGVVSCAVTERARELGIRLALGATTGQIARLVLRDGASLAAAGALAGVACAFVVGRVISRLLFGLSPTDPLSYLAAGLCLALVTLIAAAVPAGRAMATDPIVSLRSE
jgi:predicted permease